MDVPSHIRRGLIQVARSDPSWGSLGGPWDAPGRNVNFTLRHNLRWWFDRWTAEPDTMIWPGDTTTLYPIGGKQSWSSEEATSPSWITTSVPLTLNPKRYANLPISQMPWPLRYDLLSAFLLANVSFQRGNPKP